MLFTIVYTTDDDDDDDDDADNNNNNNEIMFKRTWNLSNAVCFKHDNNVCACAVD